jgi:hypothetical protein
VVTGASGLVLIAAGCVQPVAAIAAPQIAPGEARIWFYRGYEPAINYSSTSIPTIAANGTYVGRASLGSVFYRDVPAGRYDIAILNPGGFSISISIDEFQSPPWPAGLCENRFVSRKQFKTVAAVVGLRRLARPRTSCASRATEPDGRRRAAVKMESRRRTSLTAKVV